jgi:hexokinase
MTALINDTTGTLIASNYVDPNTKIAVIFGTGCNAAYMEHAGNIPKMDGLGLPADQEMAINVGPWEGQEACCVEILIDCLMVR